MGLDVSGRAGRGLLSSAGLHARRGGPLADAVEGGHSDFILGVGVQSPDAVAGGGDAVHRLVLAVRPFGSVLDDVVGDGVWVAGVPGDGHTGGGGLCDYGCAGRLWQSWGLESGENYIIYYKYTIYWLLSILYHYSYINCVLWLHSFIRFVFVFVHCFCCLYIVFVVCTYHSDISSYYAVHFLN